MRKTLLPVVAVLLLSGTAMADAWNIAGTRPLGMAGAFVAVAEGPLAQQWNPAGLAQSEKDYKAELNIYGGASYVATKDIIGTVNKANDIYDNVNQLKNKINSSGYANLEDAKTVTDSLSILDDLLNGNNSIFASVNAGVGFKVHKLAISVNNYTSISAKPYIDIANLGLNSGSNNLQINTSASAINQSVVTNMENAIIDTGALPALRNLFNDQTLTASQLANSIVAEAEGYLSADQMNDLVNEINKNLSDSQEVVRLLGILVNGHYEDNETAVTAQVAALTEVAIGYGHGFMDGGLKVGANLKLIRGDISAASYRIFNDDKDVGDVISDAWDDRETSYQPAIDIGINADINKLLNTDVIPFSPKLGLVAKNINAPKFKTPHGKDDYKVDPQLRMGVAFRVFNPWIIAADVDLTKNHTILDTYDSQQISLGTEVNIVNNKRFNLPLRAGIMKNMAGTEDLMVTAGMGLMFAYFNFELAGAVSTGTETVDGHKIPRQAGAAVSMSFLF